MRLSKIFLILAVVVGFLYVKGKVQARLHSGHAPAAAPAAAPAIALYPSSYVMESAPAPGSPRLSLLFLDENRVQFLGDNEPWGKNNGIAKYELRGDVVVVTHACGVWQVQHRGDVLYVAELNANFRLFTR